MDSDHDWLATPARPWDSWEYEYRGYHISRNEYGGWQFVHEDYDGPGDRRCGNANSLEDVESDIDEIEELSESKDKIMDMETLRILAESDPQVFAETIQSYGLQIVGTQNLDPLDKHITQESVLAMASIITPDINENTDITPEQLAVRTLAEEYGYIVSLCLE